MGQLKSLELSDPERSSAPKRSSANDAPRSGSTGSRAWVWLVVAVLAIAGFWYYRSWHSKASKNPAASAPGQPRSGGPSGKADFSVPVVVATTSKGDLPVYLNGLGTVTPLNTVTIRSRVDGQLVNVGFKEGQFVKAGDLLAEIDPRPFQVQLEQAQGQLAKDVAQRKDAEVNLERFKLLYQEGVIPKQQLDTQGASVSQFDGAIKSDQAQIDNAKLQLTYSRITAPISGRVGLRLVDPGNIVHATDTNGLLIITEIQPIAVIFTLPQDQLPQVFDKLRKGAANLPVEAFDRDNTDKIASGKLLTIDNQIDVTTGTYKLKAIFNNDDSSLFPNQFVNTHLLVDTRHNLSLIPLAALQRGPQGTYVYVVGNGNTVKIHNITVAQTNGGMIGVSAGLQPGDLVVTDGQDKLQDGTKVIPNQAPAAPVSASEAPAAQPATPTYSKSSSPKATPPADAQARRSRGAKP
jgi:membrane fusion protein, multidrug efflux system